MSLVFALIVILDGNAQDTRKTHWYDLNRCQYFAVRLTRQRKSPSLGPNISAFCVPEFVDLKKVEVFK